MTDPFAAPRPGAAPPGGGEQWLADAYRGWGPLVHALARRSLGDVAEAEDVTQQVFLAAWRGRAGYRPERGPFAGWLVGIARHRIADALAARTRRAEISAAVRARPEPRTSGQQPEDLLDRLLVARELAKLPPAQQQVLRMAFWADLTHPQIAARTGLPLGTVKSHARRGMHRLRSGLEAEYRGGRPADRRTNAARHGGRRQAAASHQDQSSWSGPGSRGRANGRPE